MRIVSTQYHVSIPIVHRKLREGKARKVAINLIAPHVGIVVDGHHDYVASLIDKRPLTIVIASQNISDGLSGAGLLDYWAKQADLFDKKEGEWQFYELFSGKGVKVEELRRVCDDYPDYTYSV